MTTSVTEEVDTDQIASPSSLEPRGMNPTLPPDANPEPLPIGLSDMYRLARKTYRAERRYYPRLERPRPMTSARLSASLLPKLKRPVFIIGAAPSGTSFLGDCIGRIPEITYHHEPPATKAAGRYVYEDLWTFRRSRWFFRTVYSWLVRVERDGDLRFSEKTPTNIFIMPFLARAFPDAQFVHIIRDGRDAAASHMNKPWLRAEDAGSGEREPGGYLHGPWPKFWVEPDRREEFVSTSDARRMAWAWRRYTETGLSQASVLGAERYHELRYEDLVREPIDEGERILRFLDIKGEAARELFLNACLRADDSSVGTHRSTFFPSEMAEIDAEAGDLLRRLGYTD
ncbi:MAG: sulfotransferase [Chloroflexota bacterium]